ncbi:hypothetical protein LTR56_019385 [Elasticomyces elasticus]|nr:hypothetical protein LTR56_019385 [Elasticomyces elasticus]KAK3658627.1 hypothetical protein LTR22_008799 [Elasticomyces elasticus]KAK4911399.1 hypothetical protein LTR49_020050 [Elasticomyces elasticus]KAK5756564.1 hypothetical protein LTS12_013280 [Elasticomyces elasticus]
MTTFGIDKQATQFSRQRSSRIENMYLYIVLKHPRYPSEQTRFSLAETDMTSDAATARQEPKFPWDCDVPQTAFWDDIEYNLARDFLQCYTEPELSQMTFDESLSQKEKLEQLREILKTSIKTQNPSGDPASLPEDEHKKWRKLKFASGSISKALGDTSAFTATMRELYEVDLNGGKDMSALYNLSILLEEAGDYAEAEASAREVLPWLQSHATLGHDSPQALGCMRMLVNCSWKQKKYEEAEEWIEKCKATIENMTQGPMKKYVNEEEVELADVVERLKAWRAEQER